MMKILNTVYLFLLIGGLIVGCQFNEELVPNNSQTEGETPRLNSSTGDENARKATHTSYGAFLTGSEEVPAVNAPGTGTAKFQLTNNGNAIDYEVKVVNTTNITGGHIHLAPFGVNGPVVVNLLPVPSDLENDGIVTGTITGGNVVGPLSGIDVSDDEKFSALLEAMNNGETYVNIHTTDNRGGEIRGQISMILPNENGNYNTRLSGSEEVPPRDTQGRGVANFKFNSDNSALSIKVNVANLENVRAAHIHLAKAGVNGPVVVDLRLDKVEGPVNGVYAQGVVTSDDLKGLLLGGDLEMLREAMRTGNTYVNVHTDNFPPGEIRGQL